MRFLSKTPLLGIGALFAGAATAAAAQADTHLFWYIARAAGLGAYLVLFINVCLGLGVHTRIVDRVLARWQAVDLHQFTALLALGLLGVHLAALLADHFIGFTLPQLLVPFASPYRPVPTAFGVVALYLLVAITASFWMRQRIGQRAWRTLHYATFGAYVLALLHGLLAGTDASTGWGWALYWSTGWIVLMLTLWRFGLYQPEVERRPAAPHRAPANSAQ